MIGIDPNGRINLSLKKADSAPDCAGAEERRPPAANRIKQRACAAPASFEDKLKQFMQDSDSRMSGNKLYDRRSSSRRRRD